jgi:DNA-binding transcriptional ArsR family regulator
VSAPFEALAGLNRLVHEPARLAILTALSAGESADFLFLQSLTGLSKGNLSSHLSKLAEAGLVDVTKDFAGNVPQTRLALTREGRKQIDDYWRRIDALRKDAKRWPRR